MASSKKTTKAGSKGGKRTAKKGATKAKAEPRKVGRPRKPKPPGGGAYPKQERGTAWIERVEDPVHRTLARSVRRACDVFGISDPSELFDRTPPKKDDYRGAAANSVRELAIGLIALLGRELGLAWADLHARHGESGRTQVQYLYPAHRWSLVLFSRRAAAFMGWASDGEDGWTDDGEPMGDFGYFLRERYTDLLRQAQADIAQAPLPLSA